MVTRDICKKGTLLIPSGPSHDPERMHLHIICTDADDEGKQLIVSVSTRTNAPCDETCLLQSYEHDFLKKESYVFYRRAKIIEQATLVNGLNANLFVPKHDMNGQTFLKIVGGICRSRQTSRRIKKYFGCDLEITE